MYNLSALWSHRYYILTTVSLPLILFGCGEKKSNTFHDQNSETIKVDTINTLDSNKLELTKAYCQKYYGFSKYTLDTPKMIVVHFTAIPTLEETVALFKQDHLAGNRTYINKFSALNVGIHYVVDKDGSIYNLTPDSVITRHVIGFNHVSIGIENVAGNSSELTPEQLESDKKLIQYLYKKHPDIQYLIGHHEYNRVDYPHYSLFKSLDKNYMPYDKPDPGDNFMKSLRSQLIDSYGLEFKK